MENKKRKSNFELLRIISMIMIVAHHFAVHSEFEFAENIITINRLWIQFIAIGGRVGVTLFIFISGYFLIDNSKCKISKLLKLWGQIFFYSVIIYFILVTLGQIKLEVKSIVKVLFPVLFEMWGFASIYLILYIFSPYINIFLNKLDRENYKKLIILMTFCWCIIPTFTSRYFGSNSLIYFTYLYSIAGYIKLWKDNLRIESKKMFVTAAILILLTFSSSVILDILGTKYSIFAKQALYFSKSTQRINILAIAMALFIGFKNLKIQYNKIINTISKATFGVFLIHDNPFIRTILWKNIFHCSEFENTFILIPYSIVVIIIVYICCTLIELFRINSIEKIWVKLIDIIEKKINLSLNKIYNLKFIEKI